MQGVLETLHVLSNIPIINNLAMHIFLLDDIIILVFTTSLFITSIDKILMVNSSSKYNYKQLVPQTDLTFYLAFVVEMNNPDVRRFQEDAT